MTTEEKIKEDTGKRYSNGGRHFSINTAPPIYIPTFSVGKCKSRIYGTNRNCTNYGELGDGKCVVCWDKKESNKRAVYKEKYLRKLRSQSARQSNSI